MHFCASVAKAQGTDQPCIPQPKGRGYVGANMLCRRGLVCNQPNVYDISNVWQQDGVLRQMGNDFGQRFG